jgi:ABC-type glycerol-3-phosphate transport system permease component
VNKKRVKRYVVTYIGLLFYFSFLSGPVIWLFISAFRDPNYLFSKSFPHFSEFTIQNFIVAMSSGDFPRASWNSFYIAITTTISALFCGILAGYGLSRFRIPGRDWIILGIMSTRMFPTVLLLISFYLILFGLGIIDTYTGMILSHLVIVLPFVLWMLKGFFDSVPIELDEAAMIDGASRLGTLFKIVLPVAAPGLAVGAFYAFILSWGNYLFSSIISQSYTTKTLPVLLKTLSSGLHVQWGPMNAATVITMIPSIIVFVLVQRWIVEGLAKGAVK